MEVPGTWLNRGKQKDVSSHPSLRADVRDATTSAVSKAAYSAGGNHSGVSGRPPVQGTSPLDFPWVNPGPKNSSSRFRAFVLLGKTYPANDAPGIEIAGKLALIVVARHQHDDTTLVDVLEVDGGGGAKIAREGFRGLEHHFLPDPSLRDLSFRVPGASRGPSWLHFSSGFPNL